MIKEKALAVTIPQFDNGVTYYHFTTPHNASNIMETNVMLGSNWGVGYVICMEEKAEPICD